MNGYVLFLLGILSATSAKAQSSSSAPAQPTTQHETYFEQVAYFGADRDHYTLSTFLKDSTLYRVDTYRLIDKADPYDTQAKVKKVAIHQGQTKILYPTGQVYLTCEYDHNVLHGPLHLYHADGSLKRRERYKHGYLTKSQCYTPKGN